MNLTYKVLWIDDKPEHIELNKKQLAVRFESLGLDFDVEVGKCSKEYITSRAEELRKYNPLAFILFDCRMGACNGYDLAAELRRKINTDFIYYSSYGTLRELRTNLLEVGVDGAYCLSYDNAFVDNLWDIFMAHIAHDYDIENMRGMVIDEMSDVESWSRAELAKALESCAPELCKEVVESAVHAYEKLKEQTEGFGTNLDSEHFSEFADKFAHVDFEYARRMLQKFHPEFKNEQPIHRLQVLRNKYAHQSAELDKATGVMRLYDVRCKKFTEELTSESFIEVRKLIQQCRKIKQALSS